MSDRSLTTYLNDHLAGSVAALELLDHLVGAAETADAHHFFATLRADVAEDQQTLQELLQRFGGTESRLRRAGAWLAEKLGEGKLRLDRSAGNGLQELEAFEMLALGIQGKQALWRALEVAGERRKDVWGIDLTRLQQRARDQHQRVEARRLAAARTALGGAAEGTSSADDETVG